MKRGWLYGAAALAAVAAGLVAFLRPRPPEEFPLARLVPEDALLYAGFRDWRRLDDLARLLRVPEDPRLREARPHLAGEAAVYLDRGREWVLLARLTRTAAAFADAEVEEGALVAGSPEALRRRRARKGSILDNPSFQAHRMPIFVDLEGLGLPGRLRDFGSAGFAFEPPLTLRGRAAYPGRLFRLYLEHYVHAPLHGPPERPGPAGAAVTEHLPRLWDDWLRELTPADRERVEREAAALSRDFLNRRSVREFLGRLGPTGGVTAVPTSQGLPALAGWVDLPDPEAEGKLGALLLRAAGDIQKYARDRGEASPFEIAAEAGLFRVKLPYAWAQRLGDSFTPAYAIRDRRFFFTTAASALAGPGVLPGGSHAALEVEVAPALEMLESLAGPLADFALWEHAERKAAGAYAQMFTPSALLALQRQMPEAADRARFLRASRVKLELDAMRELEKTDRYRETLKEKREFLEKLAEPFRGLSRVALRGRYTSEGLDLELRGTPR